MDKPVLFWSWPVRQAPPPPARAGVVAGSLPAGIKKTQTVPTTTRIVPAPPLRSHSPAQTAGPVARFALIFSPGRGECAASSRAQKAARTARTPRTPICRRQAKRPVRRFCVNLGPFWRSLSSHQDCAGPVASLSRGVEPRQRSRRHAPARLRKSHGHARCAHGPGHPQTGWTRANTGDLTTFGAGQGHVSLNRKGKIGGQGKAPATANQRAGECRAGKKGERREGAPAPANQGTGDGPCRKKRE